MASAMDDLKKLREILLEKSVERRAVRLASGRESDFYVDCKQTSLHPEGALLLGKLFWEKLAQGDAVSAIGGPALGACPLVTAVSVESMRAGRPIPAFIVRKPKDHGTQTAIEGIKNLQKGMSVAVIEDVVTSGGSLLSAIEAVEAFGLQVRRVLAILDREEGGREAFAAKGYSLETLFTKTSLLGQKS